MEYHITFKLEEKVDDYIKEMLKEETWTPKTPNQDGEPHF